MIQSSIAQVFIANAQTSAHLRTKRARLRRCMNALPHPHSRRVRALEMPSFSA